MTDKPDWLKVKAPVGDNFGRMRELTRRCGLHTVCDSSQCPNISDCWSRGQATFLVLGKRCTRNCAFCAVGSGRPEPVDEEEPRRVAEAVKALNLSYVVITSVTRDDLPDQGAGHFAAVVREVRATCPGARIELLIPDMQASGPELRTIVGSGPNVVGHNIETVARLQSVVRDRRSSYGTSLSTLRKIKELYPSTITKSSLMLGLGEELSEVVETLHDLRGAGVEVLTIGQYLRPRGGRLEVVEYLRPEVFERLGREAREMGFRHVASSPLVRSSFNAHNIIEEKEENRAH